MHDLKKEMNIHLQVHELLFGLDWLVTLLIANIDRTHNLSNKDLKSERPVREKNTADDD